MRSSILKATCVGLGLAGATGLAAAHPGHADGLTAGLLHPLLGADHLWAMLAVGLWSAVALPAGQRRSGPAVFIALLALGAAWGSAGLTLPLLEPLVAASLLVLAAMIAAAPRLPAATGLALTGAAGLLHGIAHGSEWPLGTPLAAYALGFLVSSALLQGAGLALGRWAVGARPWLWRALASGLGLVGAVLLTRA